MTFLFFKSSNSMNTPISLHLFRPQFLSSVFLEVFSKEILYIFCWIYTFKYLNL